MITRKLYTTVGICVMFSRCTPLFNLSYFSYWCGVTMDSTWLVCGRVRNWRIVVMFKCAFSIIMLLSILLLFMCSGLPCWTCWRALCVICTRLEGSEKPLCEEAPCLVSFSYGVSVPTCVRGSDDFTTWDGEYIPECQFTDDLQILNIRK